MSEVEGQAAGFAEQDGQKEERESAAVDRRTPPSEELRGELYTGLDILAFALEMEAAEAVERGDDREAVRLEDRRLGVRLAQRFVSGVHADEVHPRVERFREAYARRTGGAS